MNQTLSGTRRRVEALVAELQEHICSRVIDVERATALRCGDIQAAAFGVDAWQSDGSAQRIAGGGSTRALAGGAAFEKGGVNTSIVCGPDLPPSVVAQRPELRGHAFFAAGVSVVLHPCNPHAPAAHCNYRYFETEARDGSLGAWWFGGGADLTPFYPVLEDVRHFHRVLRAACDRHDPRFYPAFKAWCDRYFFLPHRAETRGTGGIFYDYLDAAGFGESDDRTHFAQAQSFDRLLSFMRDAGRAFADAYLPIVEANACKSFGDRERAFQLLRRGRYVEFNLLYDRGTHFGLQSGGRTESILMSLPPLVRWAYGEHPEPGSREAELQDYLRPRDWFAADPFAT